MIYAEIVKTKNYNKSYSIIFHCSEKNEERMSSVLMEKLGVNQLEDTKIKDILNFLAEQDFTPTSKHFYYKK